MSSKSQSYTKKCCSSLLPSVLSPLLLIFLPHFEPLPCRKPILLVSGLSFLDFFFRNKQISVYTSPFLHEEWHITDPLVLYSSLNYTLTVQRLSSFLLTTAQFFNVWLQHNLCVILLYEQSGYFQYFAITNTPKMNKFVHMQGCL